MIAAAFPLSRPEKRVVLRAQFDPGHVAHPQHRAVGIGANDNGAEFLRGLQPTLGPHGVGELLAPGDRFAADRARGIDGVLGLDRLEKFRDREAAFGERVGFHPDPHPVLARPEEGDAGDAFDPGELVVEMDIGVVGEEDAVVGAVG